ncbi:MAG: VCBS repeat-containing protein [Labilithrix sp.]|nr:VCBS repeat-containing protein [Labilithrix sp.]MCW5815858.1 VCBS repeat-containing protein [Labilithrix sp.]
MSSDNLDEATKTACNFGFTPVDAAANKPIKLGPKSNVVGGRRLAVGNFAKDKNPDIVVASDVTKIQLFVGKGDGTFSAVAEKNVAGAVTGRTRTALTVAATGDFDGDGYQDLILAITSVPKGENPDPKDIRVDYKVVNGTSDQKLALSGQVLPPVMEKVLSHTVGDLDGDGADDLVILTDKGQSFIFGQKNNRDVKPETIEYSNASKRVLAFVTPKTEDKPAALNILTNNGKVSTLTFGGDRKVTSVTTTLAGFDKKAPPVVSDLDENGSLEVAMLSNKLTISTLGAKGKPLTFDDVSGRTVGAADFDANGNHEIIYAVSDETKLYAACGYAPDATAIAAVELPIAYSPDMFLGSTDDLNGDGKPDLVTLPTAGGELKVYLGGTRNDPPPELTVFSASAEVAPDAGADTGTPDTGTETPDTGTAEDAGTVTADAGETPEDDAGPAPDAGPSSDAGPRPDAGGGGGGGGGGNTDPDQAGDDDDSEEPTERPVDEADGPTKKPKKPTTKPSTTGGVTITPRPQPQAVNDGCSATPASSHGVSTSAIGGVIAAMLLLGRRRRKS